MALSVKSAAFQEGGKIPDKYTCQGQDLSPPLTWGEPPQGTESLALIMDDPDAPRGLFTHWVLYNIPQETRGLPEAVSARELPDGTLQGKNDFGEIGYGGPCPPAGSTHRYRFTLYALDQILDVKAGASRNQLIDAIKSHILAQGTLIGRY
jgi:Raf kinase inhibitor-like YbhB/YbcL family protein